MANAGERSRRTAGSSPTLMPLSAVEMKTGLKKTTIYGLMKSTGAERFPAPIRLLKRRVLWQSTDVDSWIADRITSSLRRERRAVAA